MLVGALVTAVLVGAAAVAIIASPAHHPASPAEAGGGATASSEYAAVWYGGAAAYSIARRVLASDNPVTMAQGVARDKHLLVWRVIVSCAACVVTCWTLVFVYLGACPIVWYRGPANAAHPNGLGNVITGPSDLSVERPACDSINAALPVIAVLCIMAAPFQLVLVMVICTFMQHGGVLRRALEAQGAAETSEA